MRAKAFVVAGLVSFLVFGLEMALLGQAVSWFVGAAVAGLVAGLVGRGWASGLGVFVGTWATFVPDYAVTAANDPHGNWQPWILVSFMAFGLLAGIAALAYGVTRLVIGRLRRSETAAASAGEASAPRDR
jgi:hypothetical protein